MLKIKIIGVSTISLFLMGSSALVAGGSDVASDSNPYEYSANYHYAVSETLRSIPDIPEEPKYTPSSALSGKELKQILIEAGFWGKGLVQAWGTVMKESGGRPMAHNDNPKTGDNSYGLFQINMIGDLGVNRMEKYDLESYEDLFDPLTNAKIGYLVSGGGTNWGPWHGIGERTQYFMSQFPR